MVRGQRNCTKREAVPIGELWPTSRRWRTRLQYFCNGSLNRCCRGVGLIGLLSGHDGHVQALFRRRLSVPALAPGKDVASYVSTYDLSTPLVMEVVPVSAPIVAVVAQVTAVAAGIAMIAILNVMAHVAMITLYIAPILSAVHAVVPNIPPVLADVVTER